MSIAHILLIAGAVWIFLGSCRRFSARGGHACKCRYVGRYQDRRTSTACPVHGRTQYPGHNLPFGG